MNQRGIKYEAWDYLHKVISPVSNMFWSASGLLVDGPGCTLGDNDLRGLVRNGNIALREFTGLKDRNGKEIYEGDVIEYREGDHEPQRFTAEFLDGAFYLRSHEDPEYNSLIETSPIEVIGNIYENPELVK